MADAPYRANCDVLQQLRSKRRKEDPRPRTIKGGYAGATLEHLAKVDEVRDRYWYYHATKGWRSRRARGKTDLQLTA